jgi:tRNA pseudouridine synthase 10
MTGRKRSKSGRKAGKAAFMKEMKKPNMNAVAEKVLDEYGQAICESCLGRQFGQVSSGMTNQERGAIITKLMGRKPAKNRCVVCEGLFQGGLDKWSAKALKKLNGMEYNSFVVGSRISKNLIFTEEKIWELAGIAHCEPLKTELNRELGKILWKKTRKKVDELAPDVLVLFDLDAAKVRLQVNPLFIYGEYRKLVRGIPQTKWDMYKLSVEDIIAKPVMKATRGKAHSMHGAGREDIDALCLDWRPFVLEISEPRKRKINLAQMRSQINKSRKANVRKLKYSDKKEVAAVKAARHDKTYRLLVQFQKPIEKDGLNKLKGLIGNVKQKTPERVVHRRADIMRTRKVKSIKWKTVTNKKLELEIKGEAGLYVKELVSGDNERTEPSVSDTLGNPGKVIELDVIKIHKDIKGWLPRTNRAGKKGA